MTEAGGIEPSPLPSASALPCSSHEQPIRITRPTNTIPSRPAPPRDRRPPTKPKSPVQPGNLSKPTPTLTTEQSASAPRAAPSSALLSPPKPEPVVSTAARQHLDRQKIPPKTAVPSQGEARPSKAGPSAFNAPGPPHATAQGGEPSRRAWPERLKVHTIYTKSQRGGMAQ